MAQLKLKCAVALLLLVTASYGIAHAQKPRTQSWESDNWKDFREAAFSALWDHSAVIARTENRVKELERKMAGVQKQITLLHSKKANRREGQDTR